MSNDASVQQSTFSRPRFSSRANALGGDNGAIAWDVHDRAAAMAAAGEDILFLTIGDPDFETPNDIIDVAAAALRHGRTHYSPVRGETLLRETVARREGRRSGAALNAANVTIFPGAQNALFNTVQAVAGPGDEIIVPEPYYATYPGVVISSGATMHSVPGRAEDGFAVHAAAIGQAINDRSRAMLINSPGNPSGALVSRDEMAAIVKLCRDHDLWLIADEVYADLVFDEPHVSALEHLGDHDRIAVVNSVSKSLAMTGWRLGWSVTPPDLADKLAEISAAQLFGSPQFIQDTVAWALDRERPITAEMRNTYRARRDFLLARIGRIPGLRCHAPAGGMFLFIDISALTPSAYDFVHRLLDAEKVALVPGFGFGKSVGACLRLSLTQPEPVLEDAMNRLARFVTGR